MLEADFGTLAMQHLVVRTAQEECFGMHGIEEVRVELLRIAAVAQPTTDVRLYVKTMMTAFVRVLALQDRLVVVLIATVRTVSIGRRH